MIELTDQNHETARFEAETFGDLTLCNFQGAEFTACSFTGVAAGCNFAAARFDGCTFGDAVFNGCNFAGAAGAPEDVAGNGNNFEEVER